jgi:methylated-DNA-[protein]-cysteine S-methyltransferase
MCKKIYKGIISTEKNEKICKIIVVLSESGLFEQIYLLLLSETLPLEEGALPLRGSNVADVILKRFHGEAVKVPHKVLGKTPFFKSVYEKLYIIPSGGTLTYKDIAIACGSEKSARAVGNAMRTNPLAIIYPCHRVVGKNGLCGFVGKNVEYLKIKEKFLDMESRSERIVI